MYAKDLFQHRSAFILAIAQTCEFAEDFLGKTNALHYVARQLFKDPLVARYNVTVNFGQVNQSVLDVNANNSVVKGQLEGDLNFYSGLQATLIPSYEFFVQHFVGVSPLIKLSHHQIVRFHLALKQDNPLQIVSSQLTIVLLNASIQDQTV